MKTARRLPHAEVKRYLIFITGGGIGALVNWLICFGLTSLLSVYYLLSFLIAQFVNIIVNFTWHRFITFRVDSEPLTRFRRFLILSMATVLLALVLVFTIKEYVFDSLGEFVVFGYHLNYLVAVVTVTFVVSVVNYGVSKVWVFNSKAQ